MSWFIIQLQFLTRIPVPVKVEFTEERFAKSVIFAPIIGLIIGFLIAGIYYAFSLVLDKAVAVVFVLISEIIITGGLHFDGLADTFDGILSNRSEARMLEIMRDSRIGTNGTLALILVILTKAVLLFSIDENIILHCLIVMPVLSRMNILWAAGISDYARKDNGMARSIVNYCSVKEIIISTVICSLICALSVKLYSLAVLPASILFVIAFTQYSKKKIGGITGDIIGAIIEMSEVIILLIFISLRSFI